MAAFGAFVDIVHCPAGKITPDLFPSKVRKAKTIVEEDEGYIAAAQVNNENCMEGYKTLGDELVQQSPQGIDAFCGAIGGAGIVMRVAKVLKGARAGTKIVTLEPALYNEARTYTEGKTRAVYRRFANEEGLPTRTSTGLDIVRALALTK
ncbi:hypothetical protein CORC01_13825 [Colletotrichum orchidophilum]|uniref:Tryptophan synthase beta chain-like PALP domain-containing protein n=1 Tax=Colletotrichum orchidophilum TaxID=1209926 RepID=A0A1G4ANW5_9PEZI|nr:uncharacterized protein CORC01_13825 [Colletotrichum orchidophilum]OHE90880.1 hypothetical protein CORC01_13825 [Colletotrichum orchidophilum]